MREKIADYLITAGKQQFKVKVSERRERTVSDSKLLPIENKVNPDQNESMDDTGTSLGVNNPQDFGALLESIKGIVSTHTKEESSKILSVMQNLHSCARFDMARYLCEIADELTVAIRGHNDSDSQMKRLMAQNNKLQEEILYYHRQTEELMRQVKELELLKEENLTLKTNCKELLELQKKVEELELEKQENLTRKQKPEESLKE